MLPKPTRLISKTLRRSAAFQRCTLRQPGCRNNTATVVGCHINSHRKGMGNKSMDIHIAYGCHHCHDLLDKGKVSAEDQLRALIETQAIMVDRGLLTVNETEE